MENLKIFLMWTWELPQTLLGALLIWIYGASYLEDIYNRKIYSSDIMTGGISLGRFILINSKYNNTDTIKKHEYGHTRQSSYLGPVYIPSVGICSLLNAGFGFTSDYYDFWTEKWADKLGGVER